MRLLKEALARHASAADLIQGEVNMKDERRGLAKLVAGSRLR